MVEIRSLHVSECDVFELMMSNEHEEYMMYFTAFQGARGLHVQRSLAKRDVYFSILVDGNLAGFFFLRGLDDGYQKPSFGVYISSVYKGERVGPESARIFDRMV